MTKKAFIPCHKVVDVVTKAQLMGRGAFPVQVLFKHNDGTVTQGTVLAARFNTNSGNVELTVQE